MDGKVAVMSALLVGLLLSSGLAVYFASNMAPDGSDDDGTGGDNDGGAGDGSGPTVSGDRAPSLHVASADFVWDEPILLSGWVVDESHNTTIISVNVYTAESLTSPALQLSTLADENGVWSILLPYDEPGSWVVDIKATDSSGQSSVSEMIDVTLNLPIEELVLVTMRYEAPAENETIGLVTGELLHLFTDTCGVEFWPQGQSAIEGFVNGSDGTFRVPVDVNSVSRKGELWVTCGLFDIKSRNVTFQLPIPVEPPEEVDADADGDGIIDAKDDCPDTPNDEPVWPDGCSNAQLDSDDDGVTDDIDECPETTTGFTVDSVGCHPSQMDEDNDGVSDAGDQCPGTPEGEVADANGCADSQKDQDGDGVQDSLDQCPNTASSATVDSDGCPVAVYEKQDSWLCQGSGVGPVYDLNPQYGYQSNSNSPFTCEVSVTMGSTFMMVSSNGIPSHDFTSTRGCCTEEVNYDFDIPINPVNDSDGNYELVSDRGQIAVAIDGVPLYGPEDGPGGDAVALHHKYYNENRQQIDLGICGGHSAREYFHYHWDINCVLWTPGAGEDMTDYDWTKLDSTEHSEIVGWSFDGYPIYGMYGWDDSQNVVQVKSSYQLRSNGNDGYDGTDDWEYIAGIGDLDMCNGMWGPTPEFPEGIYHYVSTPLSGSTNTHVDTDGNTVPMIGFPYFQMCYRGDATGGPKGGGGQGPGPGPGGRSGEIMTPHYDHSEPAIEFEAAQGESVAAPIWLDLTVTLALLAVLTGAWGVAGRRKW